MNRGGSGLRPTIRVSSSPREQPSESGTSTRLPLPLTQGVREQPATQAPRRPGRRLGTPSSSCKCPTTETLVRRNADYVRPRRALEPELETSAPPRHASTAHCDQVRDDSRISVHTYA